MSESLGLGQLITTLQQRDAVHIAVIPMTTEVELSPGQTVRLVNGTVSPVSRWATGSIGVVDPFLVEVVRPGDTFWLFLNPGSITSLRHDWTHPAFSRDEHKAPSLSLRDEAVATSEAWMRAWAKAHMGYDSNDLLSSDEAYANALDAGRTLHLGAYEDAREHIDDVWWSHWEVLTGEKGKRGEYFRCAC